MANIVKIEGYWKNTKSEKSDYPWPEPLDYDWGAKLFLERLACLEKRSRKTVYRGWSTSRLTKESVGCSEFSYVDSKTNTEWRWPCGLKHYIEHNVKPSDSFIDFVEKHTPSMSYSSTDLGM